MNDIFTGIKTGIAVLGGWIVFWLGGLDKLLIILLAVMAIDYMTGLLHAFMSKTISSEIGQKGIVRKIMQLLIVAVAFLIEDITGGGLPLREIAIMFFVANEGISIMENAARMGLPLPKKLKDALIQLKGESEDGSKTDPPNQ